MRRWFLLCLFFSACVAHQAPVPMPPTFEPLEDNDEPSMASIEVTPTQITPEKKSAPVQIIEAPPKEVPKPEPRPERLGTPKTSQAARPKWYDSSAYAPQFKGVSPPMTRVEASELREVLLLCDVDASRAGSQDFFGGKNELGVELQQSSRTLYGGFKSSLVSAPLVNLKKGDKLKLRVYDLDYISANDLIESFSFTYKGQFPIEVEGKHVSFVCTALSRETVEKFLFGILPAIDKEFAALEGKITPDVYAAHLTSNSGVFSKAESGLEDAASLVGWDDPSVAGRVATLASLRTQRHDNLIKSFEEAYTNAQKPGDTIPINGDSLTARASLHCNKKNYTTYRKYAAELVLDDYLRKTSCVIELQLENRGVEDLPCCFGYQSPLDRPSLVDFLGEEDSLDLIATRNEAGLSGRDDFTTLQAGETRTLILVARTAQLNTKKPKESTPRLLRLEGGTREAPRVYYVQLTPSTEPMKPQL